MYKLVQKRVTIQVKGRTEEIPPSASWNGSERDRQYAINRHYALVPAIAVNGTFPILNMLSMEELAGLFRLEKSLKGDE